MFQLLYALFHFKLLLFSPRIQPRAALPIFRRINPLSISAVYASINQKTDPFYTYSHLSYWIQPRVHQQTSFHDFPRTFDFCSGVHDRTHRRGKNIHADQVLVMSVTGSAAQMSVL